MFYWWIMIIVLLAIIEVGTINLTTVWFVVSAIVSLIVSIFTDNVLLQFGIFSVGGFILLITTRPILVKLLKPVDVRTNLDRVIGMRGVVTEDISLSKAGEVKVDGKRWTAVANQKLIKDTMVKVLSINGVKLEVEKWED